MAKELEEREEKRNSFSRRRKFNEDKDIDSINDRNERLNKKIERAFGKYTLEIKNNLPGKRDCLARLVDALESVYRPNKRQGGGMNGRRRRHGLAEQFPGFF
jgi:hypothetical protein